MLGVPWGIVVGSYAPVDCCSVKKKDCLTTGAIPVSNVVLPRIEWNNYSWVIPIGWLVDCTNLFRIGIKTPIDSQLKSREYLPN